MHISPQLGALEIHMDGMGYTIGYDVAADLKIVHMSTLCTAQGPSQSIDQSKSPNIIPDPQNFGFVPACVKNYS